MYALGLLAYTLACAALAWLLAKPLTRRAARPWMRWAVTVLLVPVVFLLPFADEVVGRIQFRQLCEDAREARIHDTIPVGEELYTPDGKWRIGLIDERDLDVRIEEWRRAQTLIDRYVRFASGVGSSRTIPAALQIEMRERRLFDARTGRLLADWRVYSVGGGWVAQRMFPREFSPFGARVCGPDVGLVYRSVLKFTPSQKVLK